MADISISGQSINNSFFFKKLVEDCDCFGSNLSTMPLNERHLQALLYLHLIKDGYYDNVFLEYFVPYEELYLYQRDKKSPADPMFPWRNDISIDIVVEKKGLFAAIELKYSTHSVTNTDLKIFGEKTFKESRIVKTQAAYDVIAYNYWKDVRRLERLIIRYPNLVGGIAMIVSNVERLWAEHPTDTAISRFAITDGATRSGLLTWPDRFSKDVAESHPQFPLAGNYTPRWKPTSIAERANSRNKTPFRFTAIDVNRNDIMILENAENP